jgi:trehalose 6-phosphate phosphatase
VTIVGLFSGRWRDHYARRVPMSSRSIDPVNPLDALLGDPGRAGLFCDFDGTLSPIVDRPEDAQPLPGVPEVLAVLAERLGRVGLVSGRPVSFLQRFFPPNLVLSGLYGLEVRILGQHHDHPQAGAWREVVADVATTAAATGPEGMRVESKGLSLTLHYRGRPDIAEAVREWGVHQAARSGLELRAAKMSFELHPPLPSNKGTAVTDLTDELTAVAFVGDDLGDLAAFTALDNLERSGLRVIRAAVRAPEQADALVARADVTFEGPEGVLAALRDLADRLATP